MIDLKKFMAFQNFTHNFPWKCKSTAMWLLGVIIIPQYDKENKEVCLTRGMKFNQEKS